MPLKPETLADIMQHYPNPEHFAEFFASLKKSVIENALSAELDLHLGYPKGSRSIGNNTRNSSSTKIIITDTGKLALEIPRDRDS